MSLRLNLYSLALSFERAPSMLNHDDNNKRACLFLNSFARRLMLLVLLRLWMAMRLGIREVSFRVRYSAPSHLKKGISEHACAL